MEHKHTPGPWAADDGSDNAYSIISESVEGFAQGWIANTMPHGKTEEEAKANATLLAAAPEMLKTLVEIVNQWDKDIMAPSYMMEVRELIKKVTG
jgi:predicted RNase H-like HicB family nuclease